MTEGPYFVVVKGTNQRWTSSEGEIRFPRIYDTSEIAQKAIDDRMDIRREMKLKTSVGFEPISATEYDEKYSKLMGTTED